MLKCDIQEDAPCWWDEARMNSANHKKEQDIILATFSMASAWTDISLN